MDTKINVMTEVTEMELYQVEGGIVWLLGLGFIGGGLLLGFGISYAINNFMQIESGNPSNKLTPRRG
tara:strand:- start:273 stop:473 length:201 start_codon:yes stop_codon:yes gene_type:complete